jgi:hypothetical protein
MSRLLAVAFILFCFEVGLFLIYVPWSALWDSNLLLDYVSYLRPLILNNFFRAGVSILGAMDIFIGLAELRYFIRSFRVANPKSL